MPTGYTAIIEDRETVTLEEFAHRCARAFGALVEMRDDPLGTPIPDTFEPHFWHKEELRKARGQVAELESMTPEQAAVLSDADYAKHVERTNEINAAQAKTLAKYAVMRAKVEAWTPPTRDHEGLRAFMLQQIDTSTEYMKPTEVSPKQEPAKWLVDQLTYARSNVEYHERELAKDEERAKERTAWVKALKASLAGAK